MTKGEILPLGTDTEFGEVSAVGCIDGERYYWMVGQHGDVSMIPADATEEPLM